jgi:hypothetical protein
MVPPTPSLIATVKGGGRLWVSGLFLGQEAWMRDNGITMQVNCLKEGTRTSTPTPTQLGPRAFRAPKALRWIGLRWIWVSISIR